MGHLAVARGVPTVRARHVSRRWRSSTTRLRVSLRNVLSAAVIGALQGERRIMLSRPTIAAADRRCAGRRWTIGLSLAGMASMAAVPLLQTGVVKHLPDPPLPGFNSDKVNLSKAAFPLGVPDGTLGLLAFAANLPLAARGSADRAHRMPWLPALSTAKALVDVLVSAWYFYQMPAREKAWCIYCIVSAFANVGILVVSLPEGRRALAVLRRA